MHSGDQTRPVLSISHQADRDQSRQARRPIRLYPSLTGALILTEISPLVVLNQDQSVRWIVSDDDDALAVLQKIINIGLDVRP